MMFSNIMYRLRALLQRNSMEAELDEELRAHVEQQVEKYVQTGMSPEQAARRARLEFGGVEQVKEECRDSWGVRFISELAQDLCHGLCQLRRNPGFTTAVVLIFVLGIGANTALLSLANGVLLNSPPYPHPDQLVDLSFSASKISMCHLGMSASMYFVYRQQLWPPGGGICWRQSRWVYVWIARRSKLLISAQIDASCGKEDAPCSAHFIALQKALIA